MSHRNFTTGKLFLYEDRQSLLHLSDVVRQLTCIVVVKIILGKPKVTSLLASMNIEGSEVCKHLLNNSNHEINFDSPEILDRCNQVTELSIKETLHISKPEPRN